MNAKKSEKKPGSKKRWIGFLDKAKVGVPPDLKVAMSAGAGIHDMAGRQSVTVTYTVAGAWEGPVGIFTRIEVPETTLTEKEGAPEVPKTGIFVAIPDESIHVEVRVTDKSVTEVGRGMKIAPAPKQFIEEEFREEYTPDPAVYESDEPWPDKDIDFLGVKMVDGVKVAHILVFLGHYRPVSGVMEIVQSITLEVSWEMPQAIDRVVEKKVRKRPAGGLVQGLELLGEEFISEEEYYEKLREEKDLRQDRDQAGVDAPVLKVPGKICEYVIITTPALQASVNPLLVVKQGWPHYAMVALTTVVTAEFPAANLKESIRAFILWAWGNWRCPPRFVVLAGDTNDIPMHYYGEYASDHYYADTGGSAIPELSVSRIPTSNAAQMQDACRHIAGYGQVRQGDWGGWQNNVMLCAYQDATYETTCDQLYNKFKSRYNVIKRYAKNTSKADVTNTLNGGVLIALYRGHGSKQSWSSSNGLNSNDVAGLNNGNFPPFVLNVCCQNGWVDDNALETITESFVRRKKSVAVFAASRNSWTYPNNDFSKYLFDAVMIGNCETPASIVVYAKTKMVLNHSTSGAHLDNLRMYNLFGDPTARVASNPEWLRGDWSMDHDGWKGTLKINRIWNYHIETLGSKSAPVWSISGVYLSSTGVSSNFTGTLGGFDKNHQTPTAGRSDYKVEFIIGFSAANKQKFTGYVHTWTFNRLSGLTWYATRPYGWTAQKK